MNRTKDYVVEAFKAADLDGNKMCDLSEFVLLYRHIEKEKFVLDHVIKIYEENADIVIDNQKKMSFDKFTAICVEYSLFSESQQNIFLVINNNNEAIENLEEMRNNWIEKKNIIKEKLEILKGSLEEEEFHNWENILKELELRVLKENNNEIKPLLIAYKVMEHELERIVQEKKEHEDNSFESDEIDAEFLDKDNMNFKSENISKKSVEKIEN